MRRIVFMMVLGATALEAQSAETQVREAFQRELPPFQNNAVRVSLIEVSYAPGGASKTHTHACPVVGYVVSGAVRMQVKGEAEKVYKAGDTFYEAPNGVHQVSANASQTEPAKFVAYLVCDAGKGDAR